MSFEWDEQKRAVNLAKHGIDFKAAKFIFDGQTIEMTDTRRDYGEERIGAYGEVNGVLIFVVYTRRGDNRRIISARKAGTHEQKAYYARIKKSATD
ncbi:MAG: BrnT family toxin [Nitrospirae bacterium]|nr:BrnT family toxin [Nitrospirota bacterium]